MILSYVGENKEFEWQYFFGEFEFEFIFQGIFVEWMCVGGVGIFGFYIKMGVGIFVVEGKEYKDFDGEIYILECGICVDFVFVKVWKVDCVGNFVYCKIVWNFNLLVVICGKVMVVEVEEIVEVGDFDFDYIDIFGIFVQWVVVNVMFEKCIE